MPAWKCCWCWMPLPVRTPSARRRSSAAPPVPTGVVLTKLDGTPKGGCIIGVHEKLGLPIRFVGVGEKIDDLIFFSATDFAEALLPEVPQHKKEETEQAGEEQA